MKEVGKLVRDRVPSEIRAEGRVATVTKLTSGEDYRRALLDKVAEESRELIANPSLEEVVDIIEVAAALAHEMGYTEEQLMREVEAKRKTHGGFEDRTWLIAVNEAE